MRRSARRSALPSSLRRITHSTSLRATGSVMLCFRRWSLRPGGSCAPDRWLASPPRDRAARSRVAAVVASGRTGARWRRRDRRLKAWAARAQRCRRNRARRRSGERSDQERGGFARGRLCRPRLFCCRLGGLVSFDRRTKRRQWNRRRLLRADRINRQHVQQHAQQHANDGKQHNGAKTRHNPSRWVCR